MPNQEQSRDGIPRKDPNRPSPDVRQATDGQASARGTWMSAERPFIISSKVISRSNRRSSPR